MATHSSSLAWRVPWMEEPGGLQSTGSQRVDGKKKLRNNILSSISILKGKTGKWCHRRVWNSPPTRVHTRYKYIKNTSTRGTIFSEN